MNGSMAEPQEQVGGLVKRLQEAASAHDKDFLLSALDEAVKHPDSLITRHLEVEALRIDATSFFSGIKGGVSELSGRKPKLLSAEPRNELDVYEKDVKGFLEATRDTAKDITDAEAIDSQSATLSAINRLETRIRGWGDIKTNEQLVESSFSKLGSRQVTPDQLRDAMRSTSGQIAERIWEVVVTGREVGAHITNPDYTEQMRDRYQHETQQSYMFASDAATDALQQLAE